MDIIYYSGSFVTFRAWLDEPIALKYFAGLAVVQTMTIIGIVVVAMRGRQPDKLVRNHQETGTLNSAASTGKTIMTSSHA